MRFQTSRGRTIRALLVLVATCCATPGAGSSPDEAVGVARIDMDASRIEDFGSDLQVELTMSRAVPWRVFTLDAPYRLVADFGEVDFDESDLGALIESDNVQGVTHGRYREGWSRMVLILAQPMRVETAGLSLAQDADAAVLKMSLAPASEREFLDTIGAPDSELFSLPEAEILDAPVERQDGERPLRIVIDPGHGGLDPGAQAGGLSEADVMLGIARELRDALVRDGHAVTMTRDGDVFVPLAGRVSIARAARADMFLSLHADALAMGRATGATVYTLSEEASDARSRRLAERHDRGDLLAGIDLAAQEDDVALVLMEMARRETTPRSERLAAKLVDGLARHTRNMHKRPRLRAGFSVLRAPEIPSVLVELGFLSSPGDRANLTDPDWRARAVAGIREAIDVWAEEDAREAQLLRQ